jgi:hypothetical protein
VFDSGFFAATVGKEFDFAHNLATNKVIVRVYYAADASTGEMDEVICDASGGRLAANWIGVFIRITTSNLKVQGGGLGLTRFSGGVRTRGYLRIIATALP